MFSGIFFCLLLLLFIFYVSVSIWLVARITLLFFGCTKKIFSLSLFFCERPFAFTFSEIVLYLIFIWCLYEYTANTLHAYSSQNKAISHFFFVRCSPFFVYNVNAKRYTKEYIMSTFDAFFDSVREKNQKKQQHNSKSFLFYYYSCFFLLLFVFFFCSVVYCVQIKITLLLIFVDVCCMAIANVQLVSSRESFVFTK